MKLRWQNAGIRTKVKFVDALQYNRVPSTENLIVVVLEVSISNKFKGKNNASFIEKDAKVAAAVSLKAPLYAFPIGVLAADTITASLIISPFAIPKLRTL